MPTQPPLPFGELPEPPGPADSARAAAPTRAVRGARQPWWSRLLGRLLEPWIGLKIEPAGGPEADGRPVCYVLEDYGLSNALILDRACREAGLPSPLRPLPGDPIGRRRAYVALSRRNAGSALNRAASLAGNKPPVAVKTHSGSLARVIDAHRADPALDVQLVPVSIFVGLHAP